MSIELRRTANAGVLLKMDGVSLLLDGLCERVEPYLETDPASLDYLMENPPDVLAFTHCHADHFSPSLVSRFLQKHLRPVYGPETLPFVNHSDIGRIGPVQIIPVFSRHLGKVEAGLVHMSFILRGSRCIWFTGDASPTQWRGRPELPRPDVLIAPYAYGTTESAWKLTKELAEQIVLLHLPDKNRDPYGLWKEIHHVTAGSAGVYLPDLGEEIGV